MPRPNDVGVGVALLIVRNDSEVLLLKRKGAHEAGKWAAPGGWVDKSDASPEAAALRELKEEMGMTVYTEPDLLCATSELYDNVRCVTLYYWVSISEEFNGSPKIMEPEKAECFEWFDVLSKEPWRIEVAHNLFPNLPKALCRLKFVLEDF